MSADLTAASPAALTSISAALRAAARSIPNTCAATASVGDPAADAALARFHRRWTAHLRELEEAASLTALHAQQTSQAFQRAGG